MTQRVFLDEHPTPTYSSAMLVAVLEYNPAPPPLGMLDLFVNLSIHFTAGVS